jgi:glutamyl-tRNA reductase
MVQEPDSPRLVVVGASYRTSPAALRDRLFVDVPDQPALLGRLRAAGIGEALVLATCDRVEVAAAGPDLEGAAAIALDALAERAGLSRGALDGATYRFDGRAAVILGPDELARDSVTLRDLDTGAQEEIPLSAIGDRLAPYR